MENFLFLIFAHFIADWGLQTQFVANNKGKHIIIMFAHCMVWTGIICFTLQWLGLFAMWKVLVLLVGHFCMDMIKCISLRPSCGVDPAATKHNILMLYIDQVFHIFQLIACLA